jgi:hypothetical protein
MATIARLARLADQLIIVGTTVPTVEAIDPWKRAIQNVNAMLLARLADFAASTTVLRKTRDEGSESE